MFASAVWCGRPVIHLTRIFEAVRCFDSASYEGASWPKLNLMAEWSFPEIRGGHQPWSKELVDPLPRPALDSLMSTSARACEVSQHARFSMHAKKPVVRHPYTSLEVPRWMPPEPPQLAHVQDLPGSAVWLGAVKE